MNLLRQPIVALSGSQNTRRAMMRWPVTRAVVRRFVPGEETSSAVAAVQNICRKGFQATLDYLGEDTTDEEAAAATVEEYLRLIDALAEAGVAEGTEVSVKLSAIGLLLIGPDGDATYGPDFALRAASKIAAAAYEAGARMTVDMEAHAAVDATLDLLFALRRLYPDVGVAIQAMLRRTPQDLTKLVGPGSRVRLVKGAYDEPASVAYRGRSEITDAYLKVLRSVMEGEGYPMIGSHDPVVIEEAIRLARASGRTTTDYEIQMLYGIRADEQTRLRQQGILVRVYVPYGSDWYGYFTRRLAERPANLLFFLRALTARG
jgi:proline dehydrogenase